MTNVLTIFALMTALSIQPDPTISYIPEKTEIVVSVESTVEPEVINEVCEETEPELEPEFEVINEVCEETEPELEPEPEPVCDYVVDDEPEPEEEPYKEYYEETPILPPHVEGEVIGLFATEEDAIAVADEYGLTLKEFSNGVATFDTNGQDEYEVAEKSGLEINYIIENPDPGYKLIDEIPDPFDKPIIDENPEDITEESED